MKNITIYGFQENGIWIFQRAPYIEDGWYIKEVENEWEVYEVPQYGGEPELYNTYKTFTEAYKNAIKLN